MWFDVLSESHTLARLALRVLPRSRVTSYYHATGKPHLYVWFYVWSESQTLARLELGTFHVL